MAFAGNVTHHCECVWKCAETYIWQITCLEAPQQKKLCPTDTIQLDALGGFSAYQLHAVTGDSCTNACTRVRACPHTHTVQTLLSKPKSLFNKVQTLENIHLLRNNCSSLWNVPIPSSWVKISSFWKYHTLVDQSTNIATGTTRQITTHCNSHPISPFFVQLLTNAPLPPTYPPTPKNKTCTYTCVTCPIRYKVLYAKFLSCKLRFLNIYMCTNTKYIQHPKRTKQIKRVRCLKFCIMIHSEIPPFIMNSLF